MNMDFIKALVIGFIVFIFDSFASANLGDYFDAGSSVNAPPTRIFFSIIILTVVIAVSTSLILSELQKKGNNNNK